MYIGFDFGTKKIGIATGQAITQTAAPLTCLPNQNQAPDWVGLDKILKTWKPEALIVGYPMNADLTVSPTAELAKAFGEQLAERFELPVHFVNEHLSTFEAKTLAKERGYSDKISIDAIAAALILESWLKGEPLIG